MITEQGMIAITTTLLIRDPDTKQVFVRRQEQALNDDGGKAVIALFSDLKKGAV